MFNIAPCLFLAKSLIQNNMIRILSKILNQISNDLQSGSFSLTYEDSVKFVRLLKEFMYKDEKLSKCQACGYLHISRASFDNYVRQNKLPKGRKQLGFKELFWLKTDLDNYIIKYKKQ